MIGPTGLSRGTWGGEGGRRGGGMKRETIHRRKRCGAKRTACVERDKFVDGSKRKGVALFHKKRSLKSSKPRAEWRALDGQSM